MNMDLMFLKNIVSNSLTPAAEDMTLSYVTAVVITGLTVVFLGLVILILFVWAFGKIFSMKKKTSSPEPQKTVAKPVVAPKPVVAENNTDDDEIIAVISAAVAAMGEAEGKTYKLKSVRAVKNKPSRSAWSLAGIQNDTNPF